MFQGRRTQDEGTRRGGIDRAPPHGEWSRAGPPQVPAPADLLPQLQRPGIPEEHLQEGRSAGRPVDAARIAGPVGNAGVVGNAGAVGTAGVVGNAGAAGTAGAGGTSGTGGAAGTPGSPGTGVHTRIAG